MTRVTFRMPNIDRRTVICVGIFLLVACALYIADWNPRAAGFLSDDAVYLMMADAFSPFHSGESALTQYVLRQSLFPPVYPMLLALLGGGSGALLWSHVITTTTLVLAVGIFGVWVFAETRNRIAALMLMTLFALLPGTLLLSLDFFSEFPYLLWSMLALYLASRANQTHRGYAIIAVCVALAASTRSAGLSLVVAAVLWLFMHRVEGRIKWIAVIVAPSIAWALYKSHVVGSKGGYDRLWLTVWEGIRDRPAEFVPQFVHDQAMGLWTGVLADLDVRPFLLTKTILVLLLVTAIPAWIVRLRAKKLDAWYLLIGGAMLCVYPFPSFFSRLLLPWLPLVLFYSYLTLARASARIPTLRGKPMLAYAAFAAVFLMLMPSLAFLVGRFAEPIDPQLAHWKHTRYWYRLQGLDQIKQDLSFRQNLMTASEDLQTWVPDGQCVFTVHTAIAMLYGRRVAQQPPPPHVDDTEFVRLDAGCQYFFLVSAPGWIGEEQVAAFYPTDRLSSDSSEVVHVWAAPQSGDNPIAVLVRKKPST